MDIGYVIGGYGLFGNIEINSGAETGDVQVFEILTAAQNECDELNASTEGTYHVYEVRRIYP